LSKRVVVIGGGVVGLCSAYYLNARGFEVTVLDRDPSECEGCSFGNAGIVVPSHFVPLAAPGMVALGLKCMWNSESPFYLKPRFSPQLFSWIWRFWKAATKKKVQAAAPALRDLHMASRALYEELDRELAHEFSLEEKGLLLLCKTEHTLHDEAKVAEHAHQLGLHAEVLDAAATARQEPNVTMSIVGSVYYPLDCHLTPARLIEALRGRLVSAGVSLCWNTPVESFRREGSRVSAALAGGRSFEADEFVLTAGVWSDDLARQLNLNIPMQAGKGYSLTLPNPPQLPKTPMILTEARVAVTPMGSSLRLGGTMELAGIDTRINPSRVRGIVKSVPKYFPQFKPSDFEAIEPWCGLRPCSPDGLPYLGRSSKISNLTIATGHAMMGVSLGPISGRIVADSISGERPSVNIGLMSPDRYA
jgi:D-amino-acid dehydrogenase